MTGRTHDLAAFTALSYVVLTITPPSPTLATALVAITANFIGGLAPDIDQPTADLWNRLPAGSIIGRLITPFLGGHRFVSHSFLGVVIFGFVFLFFLTMASGVILINMGVVWWAFMIGYVSHLMIDMLTKEGVPWLFPIPLHFGIPPLKMLRVKTGGVVEKSFIFPGLLIFNTYLYYTHYRQIIAFIRGVVR